MKNSTILLIIVITIGLIVLSGCGNNSSDYLTVGSGVTPADNTFTGGTGILEPIDGKVLYESTVATPTVLPYIGPITIELYNADNSIVDTLYLVTDKVGNFFSPLKEGVKPAKAKIYIGNNLIYTADPYKRPILIHGLDWAETNVYTHD